MISPFRDARHVMLIGQFALPLDLEMTTRGVSPLLPTRSELENAFYKLACFYTGIAHSSLRSYVLAPGTYPMFTSGDHCPPLN